MANKRHTINAAYWHGDIVHIRVDQARAPRMVTRLFLSPNGIVYEVSGDGTVSTHYAIELEAANTDEPKRAGYR